MKIFNKIRKILSNKDYCVICKRSTPYLKTTHINKRKFYIECAGQLCEKCYFNLYS